MDHGEDHWHGHPTPLQCPTIKLRVVITAYYYTARAGADDDAGCAWRDLGLANSASGQLEERFELDRLLDHAWSGAGEKRLRTRRDGAPGHEDERAEPFGRADRDRFVNGDTVENGHLQIADDQIERAIAIEQREASCPPCATTTSCSPSSALDTARSSIGSSSMMSTRPSPRRGESRHGDLGDGLVGPPADREQNFDACTTTATFADARFARRAPRDLAHERETQAGSNVDGLGREVRLEHALA